MFKKLHSIRNHFVLNYYSVLILILCMWCKTRKQFDTTVTSNKGLLSSMPRYCVFYFSNFSKKSKACRYSMFDLKENVMGKSLMNIWEMAFCVQIFVPSQFGTSLSFWKIIRWFYNYPFKIYNCTHKEKNDETNKKEESLQCFFFSSFTLTMMSKQ